jgi:hypothetical protein
LKRLPAASKLGLWPSKPVLPTDGIEPTRLAFGVAAMPIIVSCVCGRRLQVQDEFAGQRGQCPGCGNTFDLPGVPMADEVETPADASADGTEVPLAEPVPAAPASPPQTDLREVRNHGGDALPRDVDFFAPPPAEIGPIFSAYSTLRTGVRPRPPRFRLGLSLLLGGLALLLTVALVAAAEPDGPVPYLLWPTLAALLAGGAAWLLTRFKHNCSYVGQEGVARYRCAGDRNNLTLAEVFLFGEAAEVRTSQTRHYVNGAYTGTDYTFTWTDVTGRVRFAWSGRHNSKAGNPKSTDPYHLGRSAEMAWSNYLLPGAFRQLELSGAVLFLVKGGNWVRVGRNSLVLHFGGKEEEWDARDIAGVSVDAGVVRIKRHGAKEGWFSSSGVFKFDFTGLGNAQLFFFLMQKVLGVPVG